MTRSGHTAERIVIVGGGISGLSVAVRLAQAGLPVTVLEASQLGTAASTRNQGWLYSGGIFARDNTALARMCRESLEQTLQFCPECLEPQQEGMAYILSKPDTQASDWTSAWDRAGIEWRELEIEQLLREIPGFDRSLVQHAYLLPDRSFRSDVLLACMAATARNAGAEIRTDTSVTNLIVEDKTLQGVVVGDGEEIAARLVILAGGAMGLPLWSQLTRAEAGKQTDYTVVPLKAHLVALQPEVSRLPFCVADAGGFNHLPHAPASVFSSNRWVPVANAARRGVDAGELERVWEGIERFFPDLRRDNYEVVEWAGTTAQAMHVEQVEPGQLPLPTVIDHATEAPGTENLLSLFAGRASLWPQLAEQARQTVLDKLERAPTSTAVPPWTRR